MIQGTLTLIVAVDFKQALRTNTEIDYRNPNSLEKIAFSITSDPKTNAIHRYSNAKPAESDLLCAH